MASADMFFRCVRGSKRAPMRAAMGWALIAAMGSGAASLRADSLLATGEAAPEFVLPSIRGETVQLSDLRGRVVLLLFGELYNANSVAAGKDVAAILARPALADVEAAAYMIVTQQASTPELLAEAEHKGITLPILHDGDRRAFASYRVMVLPSLVVLDGTGHTVLPCAGYPLDFQDMVVDAMLLAAGRLSEREFSQRRTAATEPAVSPTERRAMRLAALGEQLARRGSEDLAVAKFEEAIALDPNCVSARLGLGRCLLGRREPAKAETEFRRVLGIDAESVEAALGLIQIQLFRGGEELKAAQDGIRKLLRRSPDDPRVVYLAGVVAEESGDASGALVHYKRAAELLLDRQQRRWVQR